MSASMLGKAIINTVVYADIFDYPLTLEEIGQFLIEIKSEKSQSQADQPRAEKIKDELRKSKIITGKRGYFFLKGRGKIVELREKRQRFSSYKLKKIIPLLNLFQAIPSIKLVGVTGALAMENAKEKDDIDLFIITQKGLLWTTRFIITLFLDLLNKRRHPDDIDINDKICLNMFADENHLQVPGNEQDLFSAHEVVQMKPVLNKGNTYFRFIHANLWVEEYLPDALEKTKNQKPKTKKTDQKSDFFLSFIVLIYNFSFFIFHFSFTENLFRRFQIWYMRKRRTNEVIREGIIRFHPKDAREWVMEEYRRRVSSGSTIIF